MIIFLVFKLKYEIPSNGKRFYQFKTDFFLDLFYRDCYDLSKKIIIIPANYLMIQNTVFVILQFV